MISGQYSKEEWRQMILAGWEKWGSGTPLDPRTVEYLAEEFSKPLELPVPQVFSKAFQGSWGINGKLMILWSYRKEVEP